VTEKHFPIESSVLSSKELNGFIKEKYFTDCLPSLCVLLHRIVTPVNRWKIDLKTFVNDSLEYMTPLKHYCSFDFQFIEEVAHATKDSINTLDKQNILSSGLCHGDFYPGNIHFDEQNNPTLFDFDFSGYGWRAYDISVFLGAFGWGCSKKAIEKRAIRKNIFLKEYLKYNQMNEIEIESIFLFVPFRRICNFGRLYAYFSESWGNDYLIRNFNEDIYYLKKWVEEYKMV
jgi:Ser/Thr protein kinase RdoA (MazF antagonist)